MSRARKSIERRAGRWQRTGRTAVLLLVRVLRVGVVMRVEGVSMADAVRRIGHVCRGEAIELLRRGGRTIDAGLVGGVSLGGNVDDGKVD